MSDEHCKDCCCARSWAALGISAFTGKSIPEHIAELQLENQRLKVMLKEAENELRELQQPRISWKEATG